MLFLLNVQEANQLEYYSTTSCNVHPERQPAFLTYFPSYDINTYFHVSAYMYLHDSI